MVEENSAAAGNPMMVLEDEDGIRVVVSSPATDHHQSAVSDAGVVDVAVAVQEEVEDMGVPHVIHLQPAAVSSTDLHAMGMPTFIQVLEHDGLPAQQFAVAGHAAASSMPVIETPRVHSKASVQTPASSAKPKKTPRGPTLSQKLAYLKEEDLSYLREPPKASEFPREILAFPRDISTTPRQAVAMAKLSSTASAVVEPNASSIKRGKCDVPNCKSKNYSDLAFFSIPENSTALRDVRQRWIYALGKVQLGQKDNEKSLRVCELHFEPECFEDDTGFDHLGWKRTSKSLRTGKNVQQ